MIDAKFKFDTMVRAIQDAKNITPRGSKIPVFITADNKLTLLEPLEMYNILCKLQDDEKILTVESFPNWSLPSLLLQLGSHSTEGYFTITITETFDSWCDDYWTKRDNKDELVQEVVSDVSSIEDTFDWDAFISHASEDKDSFVRELAKELDRRGVRVWYDECTLSVGDSLRRSIDKGLDKSRYGIVVLSPRFFDKEWPQKELDGLTVRERNGQKVILPVWLDVDAEDVARYSLPLADRVAAQANEGLDKVVAKLLLVLKPEALNSANNKPRGSIAVCRLTEAQAHEMGRTLSRLVDLEYRVENASDVETILHRSVRMVVQEYSLIPEIALMLGVFTVETDPSQGEFILKGNPDVCLFAEQLVRGERPHIPELEA